MRRFGEAQLAGEHEPIRLIRSKGFRELFLYQSLFLGEREDETFDSAPLRVRCLFCISSQECCRSPVGIAHGALFCRLLQDQVPTRTGSHRRGLLLGASEGFRTEWPHDAPHSLCRVPKCRGDHWAIRWCQSEVIQLSLAEVPRVGPGTGHTQLQRAAPAQLPPILGSEIELARILPPLLGALQRLKPLSCRLELSLSAPGLTLQSRDFSSELRFTRRVSRGRRADRTYPGAHRRRRAFRLCFGFAPITAMRTAVLLRLIRIRPGERHRFGRRLRCFGRYQQTSAQPQATGKGDGYPSLSQSLRLQQRTALVFRRGVCRSHSCHNHAL